MHVAVAEFSKTTALVVNKKCQLGHESSDPWPKSGPNGR